MGTAFLFLEEFVSDMISEELQEVAYQYGKAGAWREYYAIRAGRSFDTYDQFCGTLWKKLIDLGAYVDDEHSELHPEVREYYYRGMAGGKL
jgi:hypothetical protein